MKFHYFFLFLWPWVIFTLLDPDPDSGSIELIESRSETLRILILLSRSPLEMWIKEDDISFWCAGWGSGARVFPIPGRHTPAHTAVPCTLRYVCSILKGTASTDLLGFVWHVWLDLVLDIVAVCLIFHWNKLSREMWNKAGLKVLSSHMDWGARYYY